MGYLDFCTELDESNVMELQIDIIPIKKGKFLPNEYLDILHINYNVLKKDYEKNKDKIHNEIAYKLQFRGIEKPEAIKEADMLIMIERNTQKVIDILMPEFIHKQRLKDLYKISNNPYYICDRIKDLLEDK